MRTCFSQLLIVSILPIALSACSDSKESHDNTPLPSEQSEPVSALKWTIRYLASCGQNDLDHCKGGYGLTLQSDGRFQVGPGPSGQVLNGKLTPTEFRAFQESANKYVTSSRELQREACAEHRVANEGPADEIRLSVGGEAEVSVIRDSQWEMCFRIGSEEIARNFLTDVRQVTRQTYPDTFPNPCFDAIHDLKVIYNSLKNCEVTTDCSWIQENYDLYPAESSGVDSIQRCNYLEPLLVANSFEVGAQQLKLLMAHEVVNDLCGESMKRPGCSSDDAVDSLSGLKPSCIAGSCVLR